MEHRKLGNGDLELPVVTFGAWAIGGLFWGGTDDELAVKAIEAAIDHGIDAIDTAPIYGCGHSETIVGRAIAGKRDRVKVLTKCGIRWGSEDGEGGFKIKSPEGEEVAGHRDVTAESIAYECEQSLKRLGIDCIDLYQVHWPSSSAAADETMGVLVKLKEQGKIRQIGVSNYSAAQLTEALQFAPVVSNQIKYSLIARKVEADLMPTCREKNVGVICYSPMAMGLLTGKVTPGRQFAKTDIRSHDKWFSETNRRRVLDALESVRPIAEAHEATFAQLAVAWVLAQPGVTTALVGARNAEQTIENAAAGAIRLSEDQANTLRKTFESLGGPGEGS